MNIELAKIKYQNKIEWNRNREINFLLSFEEYCQLIIDAGITPEDIGNKSGKWQLGRKNEITGEVDTGDYVVGNCRFIPMEQNLSESHKGRIKSEEERTSISERMKEFNPAHNMTEEWKQNISKGMQGVGKGKVISEEQKQKRRDTLSSRPNVVCPHCGKEGRGGAMTRYHFNNCKRKVF